MDSNNDDDDDDDDDEDKVTDPCMSDNSTCFMSMNEDSMKNQPWHKEKKYVIIKNSLFSVILLVGDLCCEGS